VSQGISTTHFGAPTEPTGAMTPATLSKLTWLNLALRALMESGVILGLAYRRLPAHHGPYLWAAISSEVSILLTTSSAPAARAHASNSCFTVALMSSTTVPGFALCTSSMSWTKVLEKEWSLAQCAYPGPQLY
jgi:hypothetical protein